LRRDLLIDKAARISDGAINVSGPPSGKRAQQVGSFWKEKFA
jgi:hypothetical protein